MEAFDDRYSRQIHFHGIGEKGQELLAGSRVAIVGLGATGGATAALLARAGVGHLRLVDRDIVEASNLQRQILFDEEDAASALPKAIAGQTKISLFNSSIHVDAEVADLVPSNVHRLLAGYDVLLDCTDNFETRYLLNDYAVSQSISWIYSSALGGVAASMSIVPGSTACLACVFPSPPVGFIETCETEGVLGPTANLAAALQAAETLKLLTRQPHLLRKTLFSYDIWTNRRSEVPASSPDPECHVCGKHVFTYLSGTARPRITLCGRNAVQIHEHQRQISLPDLHHQLQSQSGVSALTVNAMLLRFRREPYQFTVFADGRALIQGTTDPSVARSLYARFIGS